MLDANHDNWYGPQVHQISYLLMGHISISFAKHIHAPVRINSLDCKDPLPFLSPHTLRTQCYIQPTIAVRL